MQIIQTRRDFLASASLAGAAGVLGARATARRRGAARNDGDSAGEDLRHLRRAYLHRRGAAARGGLCRHPLCGRAGGRRLGGGDRTGRGGFPVDLRGAAPHPDGCRRAAHRHRRRARRVLRAVRERHRPPHRRSQGQERGGAGHRLEPARLPRQHGDLRRARPQQGHQLGHEFIRQAKGTLRRGQDRRVPWLSARAARDAGEETSVM